VHQLALRRGKAGVIAVVDLHGELIALARMDGAPLSSITIYRHVHGHDQLFRLRFSRAQIPAVRGV